MPRLVRIALVVAVVGVSAPALACSHGHVGEGGFSINLAGLQLGFAVHSHAHPCHIQQPVVVPQPYVVSPPVVVPPPAYIPPPAPVYVAPPAPVYVAPSPPPVVYVPVPTPAPAPPPAPAPVVVQQAAAVVVDRPALLAVKYTPGTSAVVGWGDSVSVNGLGFAHSVGLELRPSRWFSLRSDFEMRPDGRSWDMIGAKFSLPNETFRPYASVSLSGSESKALPGKYQLGVAGAAGLDVFLGKHFFLEAEARYRVSPGDCCREVPHLTALVGGGVAFF